jgi:hypothetical protein
MAAVTAIAGFIGLALFVYLVIFLFKGESL